MKANEMITPETARQVQELARHQTIKRLLADILTDMRICEIEGWDPMEYPKMLKDEIDRITDKKRREDEQNAEGA